MIFEINGRFETGLKLENFGSRLFFFIIGVTTASLYALGTVPDEMDLFTMLLKTGPRMSIFSLISSVGRRSICGQYLLGA